MEDKELLIQQITDSIREVADNKELNQLGSLSRHNPEKVANMLYLYSIGTTRGVLTPYL